MKLSVLFSAPSRRVFPLGAAGLSTQWQTKACELEPAPLNGRVPPQSSYLPASSPRPVLVIESPHVLSAQFFPAQSCRPFRALSLRHNSQPKLSMPPPIWLAVVS